MEVVTVSTCPIIRLGLFTVFSDCEDINIIGEVLNEDELVQMFSKRNPDIILYDLHKFDVSTIVTIRNIFQNFRRVKIILLTHDESSSTAKQILSLGITGYISMEDDLASVVSAFRIVNQGGIWISESIRQNLKRNNQESSYSGGDELTRRELEVLHLLSAGLSNKEISQKLCIAIRTAQFHVEQIRRKLQVSNRTEAVVKSIELGLITLTEHPSDSPEGVIKE